MRTSIKMNISKLSFSTSTNRCEVLYCFYSPSSFEADSVSHHQEKSVFLYKVNIYNATLEDSIFGRSQSFQGYIFKMYFNFKIFLLYHSICHVCIKGSQTYKHLGHLGQSGL